MDLSYLRLLFDFGLLVLIWLVQLIIYPSFKYLESQKVIDWHNRYSNRISLIVIPLMIGQLIISIIQLKAQTYISYFLGALVLSVWLITFLFFVPLHQKISKYQINSSTFNQLITVNWWRTAIWTTIFIVALLEGILTTHGESWSQ